MRGEAVALRLQLARAARGGCRSRRSRRRSRAVLGVERLVAAGHVDDRQAGVGDRQRAARAGCPRRPGRGGAGRRPSAGPPPGRSGRPGRGSLRFHTCAWIVTAAYGAVRPRSGPLPPRHPTGRSEPMYRLMGGPTRQSRACAAEAGQGTVEYVALILLVALVMAGVVAAMKGFRTDEGKELGDVILREDQGGGAQGPVLRTCVRSHRLPVSDRGGSLVGMAVRDVHDLPIAVFDSGVGGLTVLHECLVSLPARGLRLPRRHRALPLRRPLAPRSCAAFALRAGRHPARRGREADRGGLQLGHGGGAACSCGPSSPAGSPVVGVVTPESRLAARGHAQRPRRAAGHRGHGRPAAPTRAPSPRPRPRPSCTPWRAPSSRR